MMLAASPLRYSIPAADLARAKQFFAEKLELTPILEHQFAVEYQCGGMNFAIVPSDDADQASYSLMTWLVDDLASAMAKLRANGIVFEDYDHSWLKTIDGIANLDGDLVAWFKDSEGNLLSLAQLKQRS